MHRDARIGQARELVDLDQSAATGSPSMIGSCRDGKQRRRFAASLLSVPWAAIRAESDIDQRPRELYNLERDFGHGSDLAAQEPQRLRASQDLWWAEAARNQVLPVDTRAAERFIDPSRPSITRGRNALTYFQGMRLPEGAAADTKNRSHAIVVEVEVPSTGAEGVLIAQGDHPGGNALLVQNRRVVYHYNFVDQQRITIARIERTMGIRYSADETSDIGFDNGTPVSESYRLAVCLYGARQPRPDRAAVRQVVRAGAAVDRAGASTVAPTGTIGSNRGEP